MRKTTALCVSIILASSGALVSGCDSGEQPYDGSYKMHKEACERSIKRATNSMNRGLQNVSDANMETETYNGSFVYVDGRCKCDEVLCDVGEVCNDYVSLNAPKCVSFVCANGQTKCIDTAGMGFLYECKNNAWRVVRNCGIGSCANNVCGDVVSVVEESLVESEISSVVVEEDKTVEQMGGGYDFEQLKRGVCEPLENKVVDGVDSGNEMRQYLYVKCVDEMNCDYKDCYKECDEETGCEGCVEDSIECEASDGSGKSRQCKNGEWGDFECGEGYYCNKNTNQCEVKVSDDAVCSKDLCENDAENHGKIAKCGGGKYGEKIFCDEKNKYSCESDSKCGECVNGERECTSDGYRVCGMGKWSDEEKCKNNESCVKGKCVECEKENDKRCNDKGYIEICNEGKWINYKDYNSQVCSVSGLECKKDEGVKSYCVSDSRFASCENGAYQEDNCKDKMKCEQGKCVGDGSGGIEICVMGRYRCNSNKELEKCIGVKWIKVEDGKWAGLETATDQERYCACAGTTNGPDKEITNVCGKCYNDSDEVGHVAGDGKASKVSCNETYSGYGECLNKLKECVDGKYRICQEGAWKPLEETCKSECEEGKFKCDSGKLFKCNGGTWVSKIKDDGKDNDEGTDNYKWSDGTEVNWKEADCDCNDQSLGSNVHDVGVSKALWEICPCINDSDGYGVMSGESATMKCGVPEGASCKGDHLSCGECLNGRKKCGNGSDDKYYYECNKGVWSKTSELCVEEFECTSGYKCEAGLNKCINNKWVSFNEASKKWSDGSNASWEEKNCTCTAGMYKDRVEDIWEICPCIDNKLGGGDMREKSCLYNNVVVSCYSDHSDCGECFNGAKHCADNGYQTCMNGRWGETEVCQNGETCVGGICVKTSSQTACIWKGYKCKNNSTLDFCNGLYIVATQECGYGKCHISAGGAAGNCGECLNGTSSCVNDDGYKVCNDGKWSDVIGCGEGRKCKDNVCKAPDADVPINPGDIGA